MHFSNYRSSSLQNRKQQKPCPYHSRVSSICEDGCKFQQKGQYSDYARSNRKASLRKQTKYRIDNKRKDRNKSSQYIKLPKLPQINTKSRIIKNVSTQPTLDPEYYSYGERQYFGQNYYEDLKLDNQGWPAKYMKKVTHARDVDIMQKAQYEVKQIYSDEYEAVRKQLDLINKIKNRYKVLENIQSDRNKYESLLKKRRKMAKDNYKQILQNFNFHKVIID